MLPADGAAAGAFITKLFQDAPGYFAIWAKGQGAHWFQTAENDKAASTVERLAVTYDVYIGCGLHAAPLPPGSRGDAQSVIGIGAAWSDVDYRGPAHKKSNLPPDRTAAEEFIAEASPHPPSTLVHSGHGLQAWWMFREPWMFDDQSERARAELLIRRMQSQMRDRARERGWDVDMTWDLSRVLRLPGTVNHKWEMPAPVALVSHDDELRINPSEIDEVTPPADPTWTGANVGGQNGTVPSSDLDLDAQAEPSTSMVDALADAIPKFRATMERKRRDLQDQSPSAYDLALASFAAQADWTDQQIVNLLIYCRRRHGDDLKLRQDYYQRTLQKAHRQAEHTNAVDALDDIAETVVENPEKLGTEHDSVLRTISQALGIEIAGAIKRGAEPARYALILRDGNEIGLGSADALLQPGKVRAAIYDVTGWAIPPIKPAKWAKLMTALTAVTRSETPEDAGQVAQLRAWMTTYIEHNPYGLSDKAPWSQAVTSNRPFVREGSVWVHGESLRRWLRDTLDLRLPLADVWALLLRAGFQSSGVSVRGESGVLSRRYWRSPANHDWVPPDV